MGNGLLQQPHWSRTMLRWVLLFFFVIAVTGAVVLLLLDNSVVDEASIVPKTEIQQSRATRVEASSSQPSQPMAPGEKDLAPFADDRTTDQTTGPARTVGGWLVRAADRSPLSLCKLRVATALNDLIQLDARAPWSTTADEQGLFSLAQVPTKDASLVVLMPSGLTVVLALEDGEHDLLDQELVLDTGFIVEGEVLDMLGAPIEGARVIAANSAVWGTGGEFQRGSTSTSAASHAATTDSGGFFRLPDVVRLPHSASVPLIASAATFVAGELDVPAPHSPSVTGPDTT